MLIHRVSRSKFVIYYEHFLVAQPLHWVGHAVAELVEALCYKSEGREFDSR
jgi:hypothetical protein